SDPSPVAVRALFARVRYGNNGLADDPIVRDSVRALARRVFHSHWADLEDRADVEDLAGEVLARHRDIGDLPVVIDEIARSGASYRAAIMTLVRLTGEGVDEMPVGWSGTAGSRAAAQRWWRRWYEQHRASFQPPAA